MLSWPIAQISKPRKRKRIRGSIKRLRRSSRKVQVWLKGQWLLPLGLRLRHRLGPLRQHRGEPVRATRIRATPLAGAIQPAGAVPLRLDLGHLGTLTHREQLEVDREEEI